MPWTNLPSEQRCQGGNAVKVYRAVSRTSQQWLESQIPFWHLGTSVWSSSQMDEAGISDFKAQLSHAWKNCKQELIHIGSSISGCLASRGWKQNSPLVWIILGTWSDSSITGVKDMRLWSDSLSFSRGVICFTKVVRKWDPFPQEFPHLCDPKFQHHVQCKHHSPFTLLFM